MDKPLKIKVIVGFRRDQEHTIDISEAHKAYFLFLNPAQRGVFNDGLALRGEDIQEIVPDYHAAMGWNASHVLNSDDWNEIHKAGVELDTRRLMTAAKEVASNPDYLPQMNLPLLEIVKLHPRLLPENTRRYDGLHHIGMRLESSPQNKKPKSLSAGKK